MCSITVPSSLTHFFPASKNPIIREFWELGEGGERENVWKEAAFSCAYVWLLYSTYTAIQTKHLFATLVQNVLHSENNTDRASSAAYSDISDLSGSRIKYANLEKAL